MDDGTVKCGEDGEGREGEGPREEVERPVIETFETAREVL